jgi:hypothetical protein
VHEERDEVAQRDVAACAGSGAASSGRAPCAARRAPRAGERGGVEAEGLARGSSAVERLQRVARQHAVERVADGRADDVEHLAERHGGRRGAPVTGSAPV